MFVVLLPCWILGTHSWILAQLDRFLSLHPVYIHLLQLLPLGRLEIIFVSICSVMAQQKKGTTPSGNIDAFNMNYCAVVTAGCGTRTASAETELVGQKLNVGCFMLQQVWMMKFLVKVPKMSGFRFGSLEQASGYKMRPLSQCSVVFLSQNPVNPDQIRTEPGIWIQGETFGVGLWTLRQIIDPRLMWI